MIMPWLVREARYARNGVSDEKRALREGHRASCANADAGKAILEEVLAVATALAPIHLATTWTAPV